MMRVAIRVDASSAIGMGHFTRCVTLAKRLQELGHFVMFFCKHLPAHSREFLQLSAIEYAVLPELMNDEIDELHHSKWLGVSQFYDANETIKCLEGAIWDLLIIDHYGIDFRWEKILRQSNLIKKILVIDDLADRVHDCDLLLDQNLYKEPSVRYLKKIPESCVLLLGPNYALLKDEYRKLHLNPRIRNGAIKKIIVSFGGVDRENLTSLAVEALKHYDVDVNVVVGKLHPFIDENIHLCNKLGYSLHLQTENMPALMNNSDFCIGAAGSTVWERCCVGLPSMLFAIAKNQNDILEGLRDTSAFIVVDQKCRVTSNLIRDELSKIINNPSLVHKMSTNCYALVDGNGVRRVVSMLENK